MGICHLDTEKKNFVLNICISVIVTEGKGVPLKRHFLFLSDSPPPPPTSSHFDNFESTSIGALAILLYPFVSSLLVFVHRFLPCSVCIILLVPSILLVPQW
jgi:hypothetical protein